MIIKTDFRIRVKATYIRNKIKKIIKRNCNRCSLIKTHLGWKNFSKNTDDI